MSWITGVIEGVNQASDWGQLIYSQEHNEQMQRDQNRFNRQEALNAYNRDLAFWEIQNEYNSPSAQRRRLESAGISPWTAYGNMANTAESVKSPVVQGTPPPYMKQGGGYHMDSGAINQAIMANKEYKLSEKLAEAQINQMNIENEGRQFENFIKKWQIENALPFQKEEHEFKKRGWRQEENVIWKKDKEELDEYVAERLRNLKRYEHEEKLMPYDLKGKQMELDLKGLTMQEMYQVLDFYRYKKELAEKDIELKGKDIESKGRMIDIQDFQKDYEAYKKKMREEYGINEKDPWYMWELKKKAGNNKINVGGWRRKFDVGMEEIYDYLTTPKQYFKYDYPEIK